VERTGNLLHGAFNHHPRAPRLVREHRPHLTRPAVALLLLDRLYAELVWGHRPPASLGPARGFLAETGDAGVPQRHFPAGPGGAPEASSLIYLREYPRLGSSARSTRMLVPTLGE